MQLLQNMADAIHGTPLVTAPRKGLGIVVLACVVFLVASAIHGLWLSQNHSGGDLHATTIKQVVTGIALYHPAGGRVFPFPTLDICEVQF